MSEEKKEGELLKLQDTDKIKHVVVKVDQEKEETTVLTRLAPQDSMIVLASVLPQLRQHLVENTDTTDEQAKEFMLNLILGMVAPHINLKEKGDSDDKTNGVKSSTDRSGKGSDKTKKNAKS